MSNCWGTNLCRLLQPNPNQKIPKHTTIDHCNYRHESRNRSNNQFRFIIQIATGLQVVMSSVRNVIGTSTIYSKKVSKQLGFGNLRRHTTCRNLTFLEIYKFPMDNVESIAMDSVNNASDLIKAIAPLCEKYPDIFIVGALGYILGKISSWSNNTEIKKLTTEVCKLQEDARVSEERLAGLILRHTEEHRAHMEMLSLMKREFVATAATAAAAATTAAIGSLQFFPYGQIPVEYNACQMKGVFVPSSSPYDMPTNVGAHTSAMMEEEGNTQNDPLIRCSVDNRQEEKAKMIQTLLFVAGLNTLTQTLFGTRLPAVIGASFTFVPTTLSIVLADRYNDVLDPREVIDPDEPSPPSFMFMSPLSAVPLVALTGFGLYEFGFPLWGAPTFDAGEAFAMMAASFVSLVESTGGFIAVLRYASATPLPHSILSRGVGWQFNDMINVPFSSEAFVAGFFALFLDTTLHRKDNATRKDRLWFVVKCDNRAATCTFKQIPDFCIFCSHGIQQVKQVILKKDF
ncbi:hypothetical protein LguiB_006598 [Lonicera macranthoides]